MVSTPPRTQRFHEIRQDHLREQQEMKQAITTGLGVVIVGAWLIVSLFLVLAAGLMSVDEGWHGWSDVLLNPYVMGPYILVTLLSGSALWLLFRTRS